MLFFKRKERELKMCYQLFFISTVQGIDFRLGKYPRLASPFSWGDGLNQLNSFWELYKKDKQKKVKRDIIS